MEFKSKKGGLLHLFCFFMKHDFAVLPISNGAHVHHDDLYEGSS